MKDYIETDPTARRYRPDHPSASIQGDSNEASVDFAQIFKQLFCVAAQQLANLVHEPLERIGLLFEEPLETGAIYVSTQPRSDRPGLQSKNDGTDDIESGIGPQTVSRGKYLFLNRRLCRAEVTKYAALGYRFANIAQIAEPLAKSMQVSRDSLVGRIERMRLSASPEQLLPPGLHLACFQIRPSMYKSFDVLVSESKQNQLPYTTIQSQAFSQAQMEQLRPFDNMSVTDIMRALANPSSGPELREECRWQLYNAFVKLLEVIGDPDTMMQASFSTKEFHLPCRNSPDTNSDTCTLLTVRVLKSIHAPSAKNELTYVPLSFFSAQQHEEALDSQDEAFAKRVQLEFGHHAQREWTKHKASSNVRYYRRSSSAGSSGQATECSRSPILKNPLGNFRRNRRSDEATIIDRENGGELYIDLDKDTSFGGQTRVTQSDVTELVTAGSERPGWVMDLFALFKLGTAAEGWGSAHRGGWKWDINVENSFEVKTKDQQPENCSHVQAI